MTKLFFTFVFMVLFALPAPAKQWGGRVGAKVQFSSVDGILLSGLFMPPSSPGMKTFILLHGLGSNQEEWQSFIQKLVKRGYGFLSYDARGHGESTLDANGQKISFENFGAPGPGSQWNAMVADLEQAIEFLLKEKKISRKRIGLMGASLGANICIIETGRDKEIPVAVLLSPGLNYAGIVTSKAIEGCNDRPVLIAASPGDTYAWQSSTLLSQALAKNKKALFVTGEGNRHGVQMFDGKLENRILGWLESK
ncbi:MAG: hypothetical protein A2219_03610 [Elusimicrobia bacterium RIFOXYA2_FULL_50_26]|nr:MAG: hypothetical protein A2219_03610 [Elusimicrobia bacterium RIFOXYA2_FULL_50_26]OGS24247.1 MAG: hypothetical protein A2314_07210 [Elusimicrobia bacterium RIFOXYB2_FULL_50_12]